MCSVMRALEDKEIHVHICNSDSISLFPRNVGSDFRVNLDEKIIFSGHWYVTVVGLTVESRDTLRLEALQLYLCSNIVGFSFIGGRKHQLLRKIGLGKGLENRQRTVYNVETTENYCFYKPVSVQECTTIHIRAVDHDMKSVSILDDCKVTVSLHFKRLSC